MSRNLHIFKFTSSRSLTLTALVAIVMGVPQTSWGHLSGKRCLENYEEYVKYVAPKQVKLWKLKKKKYRSVLSFMTLLQKFSDSAQTALLPHYQKDFLRMMQDHEKLDRKPDMLTHFSQLQEMDLFKQILKDAKKGPLGEKETLAVAAQLVQIYQEAPLFCGDQDMPQFATLRQVLKYCSEAL